MAKQSVTYIGTPDDATSEITVGDLVFEKGKVVEMDDKDPAFLKISQNPTFAVGKDASASATAAKKEVSDLEAARKKLNEANISYDERESLPDLQAKLAQVEQA